MNEDIKQVEKQAATFEVNIATKYKGAPFNEKTLEKIRVEATAFAEWVSGTLTKKHTALVWGIEEKGTVMLTIKAESDEESVAFARIETKKKPEVPTIKDAKALAEKYDQDGVIVFFFKGDQYGFSSYGMDREQCDRFGNFGNQVAELIESGKIKL